MIKKNARRSRPSRILQDSNGGKGARGSDMMRRMRNIARYISPRAIVLTLFILTGLGLTVTLVGAASLWLYGKVINSDFFTTRHIDITGNIRLSRDLVLQYGGLGEGDNSLAISIADVERNLRQTPWVEEVSVKRLLPDRFVIKLKERLPSFWVQKDGALYYANEKGNIIAPVESRNFLSLPTLVIEPGANEYTPFLEKFLKDVHAGALPIEAGAISSVTLSPVNGLEIFIEERDLKLSIAVDDWEGNLERLGVALGDLAKRRELVSVREARASDGNVWIIRNGNTQGS